MQAPTVALDATAVPADRGGVGRYVDALVGAFVELGRDPVVLCAPRDAPAFDALGVREVVAVPATGRGRLSRLVWEQATLPGLLGRLGADLLHSPHYTMPLRCPCATVVTLHDATFFSDPGLHVGAKVAAFRAATSWALGHADRCIVPSQATRIELVRLVPAADPARIDVVEHGVDTAVFHPPSPAEIQGFAARSGLTGRRWIAFLGTLEPRKNVGALIRGWVQAFGEAAAVDPGSAPVLVLAGGAGWDRTLAAALDLVGPHLRVLQPGYLPLEDLPALLGGADVVAYPSLGEGFGLPVLEAMACGACVLTTRRLALPEVGGDAVVYCEPDVMSIAAALTSLVGDPDRREALSRAAVRRASCFTWRECAEHHLDAYERAVAGRRTTSGSGR